MDVRLLERDKPGLVEALEFQGTALLGILGGEANMRQSKLNAV
jgi:hypothetical protein